ncbi:MAG: hypothetical protein MJE68_22995, partial [Proteobacteria bacterium]|nr:hypothetical protein [Pseudomonadota bacterium]
MNSLFANVFRLGSGWPEGTTYRHLKRHVIVELIEKRDDMLPQLQRNLDKSAFSYADAVNEIIARDNLEDIPEGLGDFILAAISLVTGLPIYVIKPRIEKDKDANLRPVTNYIPYTEYLFPKDKQCGKGSNIIILVWNGIDYYCPAVPKEIVKLTSSATTATTHLSDAIKLVEAVVADIPGSPASDLLTKSLKYMRAGKVCIERAQLATGTTSSAVAPTEVPLPQTLPVSVAAKMAHKRAASTI